MRMLVKYTSFNDFDKDGNKVDESFYLSFVKGEDVMDIPFDSFEEMKDFTEEGKLKENVLKEDFIEKLSAYDDYKDFFKGVDVLVLYDKAISVDLSPITNG